jgi:LysM repeat protein
VLAQMTYRPNASDGSVTYLSTYHYSASGALTSVNIQDGRPRMVTFTNDLGGQAIRRDESDNRYSIGDPHGVWYRFAGREIATTSNVANLSNLSYDASIAERTKAAPTGDYNFYASGLPDGNLSYERVNSFRQGAGGGQYTIRAGDTLAGIAQAVWGDAALWYKLAEANGLDGEAVLVEGQSLNLPAGVVRSHNNASTFKPYDASEASGDRFCAGHQRSKNTTV